MSGQFIFDNTFKQLNVIKKRKFLSFPIQEEIFFAGGWSY